MTHDGAPSPGSGGAMAPGWVAGLFGEVAPETLAALQSKLVPITLGKGERLFEAGDPGDALFVLEQGKVKLSRRSQGDDPRRESLLTVLGDGAVFGELSVLDPGPRTTTASTITACRLLRMGEVDFRALLVDHPDLTQGLLRELARRLRFVTDYASDLVLNDVHGRTARTLLHLAELFGRPSQQGLVVPHGLTQQEIAHMVGASRESVNKFLMELTESGCITLSYRAFVLVDGGALRDHAEHLNQQIPV